MSIRRKYKNEDAELDTGPLNDILFILMFFFLIISTLANPNVIKMNNPRATSETKAKQSVIVSINKNRDIYLGQQKIVFDSLESSLRKQLSYGDSIKPAVVINADSLVSWGDIVRIMQVAKKLGATTSASGTCQIISLGIGRHQFELNCCNGVALIILSFPYISFRISVLKIIVQKDLLYFFRIILMNFNKILPLGVKCDLQIL